jgi:hypothetical protein
MLAACRTLAPEPLLLILHGQRDKDRDGQVQSSGADETMIYLSPPAQANPSRNWRFRRRSSEEFIAEVCGALRII